MTSLLKPKGLSTYDNELNNLDSLDKADNTVIDIPNVIQKRRGFEEVGATTASSLSQIMVYKDRIIRHFDSTLQFDSDGSFSFSSFSGSFNEAETNLRTKSSEVNGNLYFTSDEGTKKISAATASDFSTSSNFITNAGGVKAIDLSAKIKFTTAGFMPAQSKTAYRIVWGIKDKNNNLILGSPSARFVVSNTSKDINTAESSTVTVAGALTSSEYFLISSKDTDYYVWFDNTGSDTEPQTSETLGKTGIQVDLISTTTDPDRANRIGNAIADFSAFDVDVSSAVVTITLSDATSGNVTDTAEQNGGTTNLTAGPSSQGSSVVGETANVDLTFSVPADIKNAVDPTDYFYQIYRTAVVEAGSLTMDDIDPGDEANLIIETGITSAEASSGEVSVEDLTPESFRESGAALYTNPVSGDGILQANERPPTAKDIALFRNSTFYANTKTAHRLSIDMLAVSGFVSGTSTFVIGNDQTTRTYTFRGATQVQDIQTIADTADSLDGTYFLINSARDEIKYYVWFTTGAGASDPAIANRNGIRVEISTGDTADAVATALNTILDATDDFSSSVSTNTVTITLAKNGNATDAIDGNTGFTFVAPSTQGDGEDTAIQEALLSSLVSAGQSIEETAISLVKVINADSLSPVYAFYLSGPDDLPGKILLENRTLEDRSFYVFTTDSTIESKFNPELSSTSSITAISIANPTQITSSSHGLSTGDKVYIYGSNSTPDLLGEYTITLVDVNNFTVPVDVTSAGTTGTWAKSDVPSDNEVVANRIYYSKTNQPEAVPIVNYVDVGPKDKAIKRILALRDNLFCLKEDGVYIITGSSAPNFSVRLLDGSTHISAADTASVLSNELYCLSSQGVVKITETGVSIVSRPIEDKILEIANARFSDYKTISFGISYESDRAYVLYLPTDTTDTVATQAYRYNTITRSWTRWDIPATCGVVSQAQDKLYLGSGDRNYLFQERKSGDRTDYADRDFDLNIGPDSVNNAELKLSSKTNVDVGDAITQEQTITISTFNRLLKKLDRDLGLDDTDYNSTLSASAGDLMQSKLDSLNNKLISDDSSGTITDHTPFSSNFTNMQTSYNALIAELNTVAADTTLKNYSTSSGTVLYEVVVTGFSSTEANTVVGNFAAPFLSGVVTVYKGISLEFEFGDQHFNQPDMTKQIREATVLLDQNNFTSIVVSFNSDLSKDFEDITVDGEGIGTFGYPDFGGNTFGGLGTDQSVRVLVPRSKQRCRYLTIKVKHINAREDFKCVGVSMQPRMVSSRGYR